MNNIGIKLNKKSRKFIYDLETNFKHPIKIIFVDREFDTEYGSSRVINGQPIIELNRKSGINTETLIHEVYHLRLKLDGFINPAFKFNNLIPKTENNEFWINWVQHMLWDKILHFIFYPKMKILGINPYNPFSKEIETVIQKNEIKNLNQASRAETLSLYYLQTFIEANSKKLLKELTNFFKRKYNTDGASAVLKGNKMINIIKNDPINSPVDALMVFQKCFEVLMPISLKFEGTYLLDNLKIPTFTFIEKQ